MKKKKCIDVDKLLKAIEDKNDELKMAFLFCPTFARNKVKEGFNIAVGIINSFIEGHPEEDSQERTEEDIYEVNNPYFLSDVFVFQKKRLDIFNRGEIESVCYIKLNYENRIEMIGFNDPTARTLLKSTKEYQKATPLHKKMFLLIDDELWRKIYLQNFQLEYLSNH